MAGSEAVVRLPRSLLEKLVKAAEASGVSLEELLVDRLVEALDPRDRAEAYWAMAEEYLREAREELEKGNLRQASEKIWGAAALAVKALAYEREGRRLSSHGELWEYVDRLVRETGDESIGDAWRTATAMHVNFYEGWAPRGEVERSLRKVKELVSKLKALSRRATA